MADVVNRTTNQYLQSVNTGDFPSQDWIINPDLSAVEGQPTKYWVITGDVITLADQATRDAIDAAELDASRDETADHMNNPEALVRALGLVILDEINILRSIEALPERTPSQLNQAIRARLGS